MFFIDQEFKELRLIKDGSDIPFLVEGDENSSDMFLFCLFVKMWDRAKANKPDVFKIQVK